MSTVQFKTRGKSLEPRFVVKKVLSRRNSGKKVQGSSGNPNHTYTLIPKKFGRFYFRTDKMSENLLAISDIFQTVFTKKLHQNRRI